MDNRTHNKMKVFGFKTEACTRSVTGSVLVARCTIVVSRTVSLYVEVENRNSLLLISLQPCH